MSAPRVLQKTTGQNCKIPFETKYPANGRITSLGTGKEAASNNINENIPR
jgi:hypothetical protein